MSNDSPLTAARKRLSEWARWQRWDHAAHPISRRELDNPYARDRDWSMFDDVTLVTDALELTARQIDTVRKALKERHE